MQQYKKVYLLGIGGIGMSALARYFSAQQMQVYGYDRTSTALTNTLEAEGITIHYQDLGEPSVPENVKAEPKTVLVIYTPAIPADHKEHAWLKHNGFIIKKRAEVLGMLTQQHYTVAVAGTHGKTTTSSIIAHLLKSADIPASAFLGGIASNYNSNLILHQGEEKPIVVAEADEFDRSFLWLHPNLAVITATDADHLDIYNKKEALIEAFGEFAGQLQANGTMFLNHKADSTVANSIKAKNTNVLIYGISKTADCQAFNVVVANGKFIFDYQEKGQLIQHIELGIPGFHNVENASAAIACALRLGATPDQIKSGLATYRGVKRRFEIILREPVALIDDYAHHPEEIRALINSVRALYPDRQITALFQPHLYSRTRDFQDGFAESLSLADNVILTNIYPAREMPIPGVESDIIAQKLTVPYKLISYTEVISLITKENLDILLCIGAGDIDKLVPKMKEILKKSKI